MSYAAINARYLAFGTTSAPSGTATSDAFRLPRSAYSIQANAVSTGTSILISVCRWDTCNDLTANQWIPQGTVTAISTSTSTAYGSALLTSTAPYAFGRAVVTGTGTGRHEVVFAA